MNERQLPAVIAAVESRLPELKKLLPSDVSVDAFFSHFKTAAVSTPNLLDASPRSVVIACVRAANDGLYVDGREAVIIVRNSKRKDGSWEKVAVYQRMYQGVLKRVRSALPGCRIEARVVRAHDAFAVTFGDNPSISHAPSYKRADDNPVIAAYAIVTEASGMQHRDVMDVEEIMAIRDRSQNWRSDKPSGPWLDHFAEMAKKTVLNRLAKLLPQASGRPALSADADDHGGADDEIEVFDATTVPLPDTLDKADNVQDVQAAKPNGKPVEAAPAAEAPSDVATWKTRLRELRAEITGTLTSLGVEEAWETWEEKYKPVPEEVVAAAKGLIDTRLTVIRGAADYAGAKG
ncbi:MAG: recombinase RecT [Allosphingosinicella sp.]